MEPKDCPGFKQNTRSMAALDQCHFCGGFSREHEDAQGGLFDAKESKRRKEEGMGKAALHGRKPLEVARDIAADVGAVLFKDYGISTLGPAGGSLFMSGAFEFTGARVLSTRKKNNARELKVWRLKQG